MLQMIKQYKLRSALIALGSVLLGTVVILLVITDRTPPTLTVVDQTVTYGARLSVDELASAVDDKSETIRLVILPADEQNCIISSDGQSVLFPYVGDYQLEITAVDESENTQTDTVIVSVIDDIPPEVSLSETERTICYREALNFSTNSVYGGHTVFISVSDYSATSLRIGSITKSSGEDPDEGDLYLNGDSLCYFDQVGDYVVTLVIADEYNNETSRTFQVSVTDQIAPVLTCSNTSYSLSEYDSSPDYLAYVQAVDEIDGDLTSQIQLDDSAVQYGIVGHYSAFLTVSDAAGNVTKQELSVIVKDTTAPVLSLSQDSFSLTASGLAPNYLNGVSASDAVDGDLTDSISVDDSSVDYSTPGTYHVSYNVSDRSGNSVTQTVEVVIQENASYSKSSSESSSEATYYVLITRTGSCYHKRKCGNGTYYEVTLSEAKRRGLQPCKKCFS